MKKKIGLLGGSFNPAHEGHIYISEKALEILELDEIWWLVAKQNPLKSTNNMASFEDRFLNAIIETQSQNKIMVSDFERKSNLQYSFEVIREIKKSYPHNNFVWLMGADNLLNFKKWYNWQGIVNSIPIAVLNRNVDDKLKLENTIKEFSEFQKIDNYKDLALTKAPCWCFLNIKIKDISSTKIRQKHF